MVEPLKQRFECGLDLEEIGDKARAGIDGALKPQFDAIGMPVQPAAAVFFLTLGIFNLAVVGWRLLTFGRMMHRIIEAVASQAKLMPADPIGAAPLPIGAPRTV